MSEISHFVSFITQSPDGQRDRAFVGGGAAGAPASRGEPTGAWSWRPSHDADAEGSLWGRCRLTHLGTRPRKAWAEPRFRKLFPLCRCSVTCRLWTHAGWGSRSLRCPAHRTQVFAVFRLLLRVPLGLVLPPQDAASPECPGDCLHQRPLRRSSPGKLPSRGPCDRPPTASSVHVSSLMAVVTVSNLPPWRCFRGSQCPRAVYTQAAELKPPPRWPPQGAPTVH